MRNRASFCYAILREGGAGLVRPACHVRKRFVVVSVGTAGMAVTRISAREKAAALSAVWSTYLTVSDTPPPSPLPPPHTREANQSSPSGPVG